MRQPYKIAQRVNLDGEIVTRPGLNDQGLETPDSTPMAPPIGYNKQPSMFQQMRDLIRSERLAAIAESQGAETFEQADDFEIGDDYDPTSPYEEQFDNPPDPAQEARKAAFEASQDATPVPPADGPVTPAPAPAAPPPAPQPAPVKA